MPDRTRIVVVGHGMVAARLIDDLDRYADPAALEPGVRDRWLVLRGGIRLEQFWIDWLTEYLTAHGRG